MSKLQVAILGAGPSAAYAYRACKNKRIAKEVEVDVLSNVPGGKYPPGAFYLRWLPTPLCFICEEHNIYTDSIGNAEMYVKKQWGDIPVDGHSSSFPTEPTIVTGYNPEEALQSLWGNTTYVLVGKISATMISEQIAPEYDVIIQTFPTEESIEENSDRMVKYPLLTFKKVQHGHNFITYNGEDNFVVRFSSLFESVHIEYAPKHIMNMDVVGNLGEVVYMKDMHPSIEKWDKERVADKKVHLLGRYAEWDRHKLSHDAYDDTLAILEKFI